VKSTVVEPAIVKSIRVKPTRVESAKSTPVDPSHPAKSAAVKPTTPAVETPAAAMRAGVGEIWLAERGTAQQSRCDCQSPSRARPAFRFA